MSDQLENGNFSLVPISQVPKGEAILPAVWQMKRKRDIRTREIKKWKARLNIDGSRMKHGIHYQETYAPVASWNSIRMLLILATLNNWHTTQIDYVLAFPQAPVEKELYMKIPSGFELTDGSPKDWVLKLHRNVYGQKQAGRVWNQYLVHKLTNTLHFVQSKVDECVFYRGSVMYVLYTDDSLLAGPDKKEIDKVIQDLTRAGLNITVEGDIQDFLGVNITKLEDGRVELTQPHLIDQIISDLRMKDDSVKSKPIPAPSSKILGRHPDSQPFDCSFNYRSIIGKLNYLEKATRADIAYIVHQCARFATAPKKEHGEAVRWLVRYLKGTRDKGFILHPEREKGLELYVDADFSGNWNHKEADDRDTARSRHGYFIMYAGCPVIWKSQLQTEICLSTTESEYTGLSYALRDAIPLMQFLRELKERKFNVIDKMAEAHCIVHEDNSGALEMARNPKYRPRTKHLNVKLHHFRDYVQRKEISIQKIDTKDQLADFLTKPVPEQILTPLRRKALGW
jgi:Reverse transcriptase (RNA-dependent DNA polymerase)